LDDTHNGPVSGDVAGGRFEFFQRAALHRGFAGRAGDDVLRHAGLRHDKRHGPDWWVARHPQYEAHDPDSAAEDKIPIASFAIDFSTIKREPTGTSEADKGYAQELTAGELTDWMSFKSQRITVSCRATITLRNGQVIANHPITYQLVSTNAGSGSFQNTNVQSQAEPVPAGLARKLYNAVNQLQFEGN